MAYFEEKKSTTPIHEMHPLYTLMNTLSRFKHFTIWCWKVLHGKVIQFFILQWSIWKFFIIFQHTVISIIRTISVDFVSRALNFHSIAIFPQSTSSETKKRRNEDFYHRFVIAKVQRRKKHKGRRALLWSVVTVIDQRNIPKIWKVLCNRNCLLNFINTKWTGFTEYSVNSAMIFRAFQQKT